MDTGEVLIAVIAVAGGLSFAAFLAYSFFGIIRYWIDSRSRKKMPFGDVVSKDEFLEYKTRVEKRLQALEAVASDEELTKVRVSLSQGMQDVVPSSSERNKEDKDEQAASPRLRNHLRP
jgi:hypothetical protein